MGEFSIAYEQVSSISNSMKQSSEKMKDILADVSQKMSEVYGEAWQSSASETHMGEFKRIEEKFQDFYGKVQDCAQYLDKVVELNRQADQAIQNAINN